MAEGVAGCVFFDSGQPDRVLDRTLNGFLISMVTLYCSCIRTFRLPGGRENKLPGPVISGSRVFPGERKGK